ncbi:testis-expressed protein 2-like [Ctenocephalides felis]|nr:testis-expressed protein 2-like [Ctenocephalides felis]
MIPICTNMIFKKVIDFIKKKLYIQGSGPEKTEFILPKYNEMNILEVPSVEEYQVPKTYEGWINLYPHFSYDPETYHLSDTIPVYVKIKGKHLIVYYTKNHVARRTTYNEPELKLNITSSVVYNLNNAKVSLLPDGLAKIRHWSKKYPICIEIENTTVKNDDVFTNEDFSLDNTITNLEKDDCSDSTTTNTFHDNTQEDEFKDVEDYEENTCARNSVSSLGEDIETNSDNSHLKEDRQRLLLFARANREKYDWYLRILSTIKLLSVKNNDKESNVKCSDDRASGSESSQDETKQIEKKESSQNNNIGTSDVDSISTNSKSGDFENVIAEDASKNNVSLMGDQQYLKYMGYFLHGDHKDDTSEISRDFNLSISKDVLWFNVLAGRVLLGILNDPGWIMKIQERIQKKLSTIKLPYYIDELECSELSLGETPPKIHRASKPVMNERGLWVDLDVTYEGLVTLVLSTKLNLMKLKKINAADTVDTNDPCQSSKFQNQKASAIYNSDLEDSADSSTSDDQVQDTNSDKTFSLGSISPTPRKQNNKSFLKVVDQVAASKFFQQATENKFVKKALVAVSNSQLRLQVDFRGLIGELVLNIPNPPSDRLWFGFRKPPRIWLTVHPAFGERNVNFTYVTNWIEKKICQEIVKNLVLPNMEDLIIPILLPQT